MGQWALNFSLREKDQRKRITMHKNDHPKSKDCGVDINDWVQAAWKSAQDKIKNLESTIKREQMKIMKPVKFYDYKTMKYTTKWVEDPKLYDSGDLGSSRFITGETNIDTLGLDAHHSSDINDQMVTHFLISKKFRFKSMNKQSSIGNP